MAVNTLQQLAGNQMAKQQANYAKNNSQMNYVPSQATSPYGATTTDVYGQGSSVAQGGNPNLGVKTQNPNTNLKPAAITTPQPVKPKTLPALAQTKTAAAPAALTTPATLKTATSSPTSSPTSVNTLAALDQNGNTVYVQPGTYNPGITAMSDKAKLAQSLADQKNAVKPADISQSGSLQSLVTSPKVDSGASNTAVANLNDLGAKNSGNSGPAYDDYQSSLKELADFKTAHAQDIADIQGSGGGLNYATGEKSNLAGQYSATLDALQNKVNEKAAALGYQVQGTQTQQSAEQQAGQLGQSQQGLNQQAYGTAAGLAAPVAVPYGTPLVNPQTGKNINMTAAGVDPSDPFYKTMQQYAQMAVNNQMTSIPSSITQNAVLNAQLMKMATAINPSFNPNVASGAGAAQTTVAGTQTQQIETWKSSLQQGQNLVSQLNDLLTKFGLNPSDVNKVNQGLQSIASNVSDPRYKMLQNYIADIANTYAQILTPAGQSPSDYKTQIANSMLDATAKGSSLKTVMQGLDQQAQAKIAGVATAGGSGGNSGNPAGSNTGSNGGTKASDYKKVNGQWGYYPAK